MGLLLDPLVKLSRTRTNYWLEFIVDAALGVGLLCAGLIRQVPPIVVALLFLSGLFLFTFIEYFFHRWLFHGPLQVMASGHASHHLDPNGYDSLPFFLPALILLGITGVLAIFMPATFAWVVSSGVISGYVAYGLAHYTIHHRRFRHPLARKWAAHHHIHHYHPDVNFGVTSPLWDILLGTLR